MIHKIIRDTIALLTFRISREAILNFGWGHLGLGLISTWIVGMGRYWDNPRAEFLLQLGVGSVVYVFALSSLLWLVVEPLKPRDLSFFRLLTFVSLVSPPAVLYAIPVQMYLGLSAANKFNALFLGIVAFWRVLLLFDFFYRFLQLGAFASAVAGLLPVTFIVTILSLLNLERVVFDLISGIRDESPNALAYSFLGLITFYSVLSFPVVLVCYIVAIARRHSRNKIAVE